MHDAVFPIIDLTIYNSKAEVAYGRVSRDRAIFLLTFRVINFVLHHRPIDILNCIRQELFQTAAVSRQAGRFRTIWTAHFLHGSKHHIRIIYKILIHGQTIYINAKVDPFRQLIDHAITFLQNENICGDFCSRCILERIIGQSDCSEQLRSLCQIFAYRRIFLIHRAFTSDERDNTAGPHLIHGAGKEIVMDQEVILVVSLVHNLKRAKRYITNGGIKKAVRQICFLKPANSDRRFLIKLLCNSSADAVQLYTIDFRVGQITRTHADEIANTAGRLQNITALESQPF